MKNKKSLGQHWLQNRSILNDIASLAQAEGVATCIEIGPGLGTLTSSLFKYFSRVIAIEYDADLARKLPGSFPGKDLQVVQADVLRADLPSLANGQPYVIVGNIPYYITSPIVKKAINLTPAPAVIVLLMQKEVAERIAATTGDYNLLALQVQNRASVMLGPVVKAAEFTPPPKVDSQVLILTPLATPLVEDSVLQLAQIGFSSPRKKLASNLAAGDTRYSRDAWRQFLLDCKLNPDARPGDLNLMDWSRLAQVASSEQTAN